MIGQKTFISKIQSLGETFPPFLVIVGPRGSGKKLMTNYIADSVLHIMKMDYDISVGSIRDMIKDCHKIKPKKLCVISDADSMSNEAKNAMLKIIEEPPKDTYFIMTLLDSNNTLATIRSRAFILPMDIYTPEEIIQYYNSKYDGGDEDFIVDICETPGEVDLLEKFDVHEFYDYVQKVVDNIGQVSTSNALKLADKVSLKEGSEGYDLKLFWTIFREVCLLKYQQSHYNEFFYMIGSLITGDFQKDLYIRGVNKKMLFYSWILAIRKEWSE